MITYSIKYSACFFLPSNISAFFRTFDKVSRHETKVSSDETKVSCRETLNRFPKKLQKQALTNYL